MPHITTFSGLIRRALMVEGMFPAWIFVNKYTNTRSVKCYNATPAMVAAVGQVAASRNVNVQYHERSAGRRGKSCIFTFDRKFHYLNEMTK